MDEKILNDAQSLYINGRKVYYCVLNGLKVWDHANIVPIKDRVSAEELKDMVVSANASMAEKLNYVRTKCDCKHK